MDGVGRPGAAGGLDGPGCWGLGRTDEAALRGEPDSPVGPAPLGDQSEGVEAGVEACALLSLIMSITRPERARTQGKASQNPSDRRKSELGEATLELDINQG